MYMKYSNGYIPKIEYWLSISKQAIQNGNIKESEYALQKAEYFIGRHRRWFNAIAGVDFTQTLAQLDEI
jgi:flagellin-specific chaperone FliS